TRTADQLFIVRARRRKNRNTSPSPYFENLPDSVKLRNQSLLESEPTALPRRSTPADPRVTANKDLKRRLLVVREVLARANFALPEAVLSDAEVARIVAEKPHNNEQLSRILGPLTASRLGAAILREVGDAS
ncbi:MAG: HRDC domain-containing protein, partial [Acidimicrobiaceae bacterium]